ncbi:MAG: hypothetical protein FWC03_12425 [Treponema sp.]|nr:hypothetical protein [Treponema sp.]
MTGRRLIAVIFGVFILFAFLPLYAQEEEIQEKTETAAVAQETGSTQTSSAFHGAKSTVSVWINRIIGYIAKIGNIFGSAAGFRIGGTTGTAIIALIAAKVLEDKAPSWVKYVLYVTGGTMFAGSGANIAQLAAQFLG